MVTIAMPPLTRNLVRSPQLPARWRTIRIRPSTSLVADAREIRSESRSTRVWPQTPGESYFDWLSLPVYRLAPGRPVLTPAECSAELARLKSSWAKYRDLWELQRDDEDRHHLNASVSAIGGNQGFL